MSPASGSNPAPRPEIDVMHRRAEPDEFVLKEDRRENENIRQVLTAVKGSLLIKKSSGLISSRS